jgi:CTP:phosphocholine cytidylyltransferase-like protein
MNIVIPMAGFGSRFAKVGITTPKPLIDVRGGRCTHGEW